MLGVGLWGQALMQLCSPSLRASRGSLHAEHAGEYGINKQQDRSLPFLELRPRNDSDITASGSPSVSATRKLDRCLGPGRNGARVAVAASRWLSARSQESAVGEWLARYLVTGHAFRGASAQFDDMAFLVSLSLQVQDARPGPRVVCHSTSCVAHKQKPSGLAVPRLTKHLRAGRREGF
jgi:hypothetical protein